MPPWTRHNNEWDWTHMIEAKDNMDKDNDNDTVGNPAHCSYQLLPAHRPTQYSSVLLPRPFFRSRDRDRGLGLQISRSRPRPWTSGLETKTETWAIRSRDLKKGLDSKPGQNELEGTRVSSPWSRDHNTDIHYENVVYFLCFWKPLKMSTAITVLCYRDGHKRK